MTLGKWMGAAAALALTMQAGAGAAQEQTATLSPDKAAFRALYKELVETNTSLSVKSLAEGTCTTAAARMAARLKAAGYPGADVKVWTAPDHPLEGGLFAVLHGSDPKAKPMLLLAHIDVVEAKREDWTRDPFTLIEENGYFYGRGASDDKAEASVWTDTLIRFRQEGFKPRRDIKLALTCGEETAGERAAEIGVEGDGGNVKRLRPACPHRCFAVSLPRWRRTEVRPGQGRPRSRRWLAGCRRGTRGRCALRREGGPWRAPCRRGG